MLGYADAHRQRRRLACGQLAQKNCKLSNIYMKRLHIFLLLYSFTTAVSATEFGKLQLDSLNVSFSHTVRLYQPYQYVSSGYQAQSRFAATIHMPQYAQASQSSMIVTPVCLPPSFRPTIADRQQTFVLMHDPSRVPPGEGSGQGVIPTPVGDMPLLLLLLFAPAYILHIRRHAKHA